MCTRNQLNDISGQMVSIYRDIYGDAVTGVFLYGSYARGDFEKDSDVDIVAIVKGERRALTNHIFSIYDILSSAFVADHGRTHRPYSNILVPVSDNVADLKNELLILKDSIRSIMRMIIKMTETNELGQFLIKDEMLEGFFNDYFFIKKDGLIPGYIEEIEKMLRRLAATDVYENMIKEYQGFYNVDELTARETVGLCVAGAGNCESEFDE